MDKIEAIKILKDFHDESAVFSVRTALETLHPELKESEGERVRKGLIKAVSGTLEGNKLFDTDVTREEALAWLEKQGQPKPSTQNGITINGVEYELIKDDEADECERCALKELCKSQEDEVLCISIFTESVATNHRFEKKTK